MFAQVLAEYEVRVQEVDLYFELLVALDNDEIMIGTGTGPQVLPPGAAPENWGRMLKGAAYLVLYNLVEAFIRRGFHAVFDAIRGDGLCGADLTSEFRRQWVAQRTRHQVKPIDGGPRQYMNAANQIIEDVLAKKVASMGHHSLPISGNLDAEVIREVCALHGVDPNTPPETRAGAALATVKDKRNRLAHGDESFAECGRHLSASDLRQSKQEVVLYVRSILQNLEQFTLEKKYKS